MDQLESGLEDPFDAFDCARGTSHELLDLYIAVESSILFSLPREIRDIIYIEFIRSGHLGIRRVCQAVYKETAHLIFKYGVCRLDFASGGKNARFGHRTTTLIQNIYIKLNIEHKSLEYSHTLKPLCDFYGPAILRRNCHISLIYRSNRTSFAPPNQVRCAMEIFGRLTGFKNLTLCAAEGTYDHISNSSRAKGTAFSTLLRGKGSLQTTSKDVYGDEPSDYILHSGMLSQVKTYLEPVVGPGAWQSHVVEGKTLPQLHFHPWINL